MKVWLLKVNMCLGGNDFYFVRMLDLSETRMKTVASNVKRKNFIQSDYLTIDRIVHVGLIALSHRVVNCSSLFGCPLNGTTLRVVGITSRSVEHLSSPRVTAGLVIRRKNTQVSHNRYSLLGRYPKVCQLSRRFCCETNDHVEFARQRKLAVCISLSCQRVWGD